MKTFTLLLLPFLLLGAQARPTQCAPRAADGPSPSGAALKLSPAEAKAVVFQLEEERMAHELYVALGAKWGTRQFENIQRAETRHHAQLVALATRAGLSGVSAQPGRFADPILQQRYDALLAQGLASEREALATGVAVEQQDLADLRSLLQVVENAELRTMVQRLAEASERHLAAFSGERGAGSSAGKQAQCGGRGGQQGRRASTCTTAARPV